MIRKIMIIALLPAIASAATLAAVAPATAPAPAGGRTASWDSYRLVVSRNIFTKDRRASAPRSYTPSAYTPRDSDTYVLLTGIVMQCGEPMAFVEDTRTGQTARVGVGQKIGSGKVVAIAADGIYYEAASARRKVSIGENLAGTAAFVTQAPAVAATPGSASTSLPAGTTQPIVAAESASRPSTAADPGTLSIEERMRLRRLQETK